MRICILYELSKKPWGGSNSFLSSLAGELRRLGVKVDSIPRKSDDAVLVNSWSRGKGRYLSLEEIQELRKEQREPGIFSRNSLRHKPIVQRLDGVARLYGRSDPRADQIQCSIAEIADFVIFQSQYSLESFQQFGIRPSRSAVIHNAVDGNLFFPSPKDSVLGKEIKYLAISWSNNLMKGFSWLPRLATLPGVKVSFIGNWNPAVHSGDVYCMGVKTRKQISSILRGIDILVHPAENDPCSNVILEALASGVPVLYHNSGGNPELAGGYGVPLIDDLKQALDEIRDRYSELRERILDNRARFLINSCAERYLSVLEQVARQ